MDIKKSDLQILSADLPENPCNYLVALYIIPENIVIQFKVNRLLRPLMLWIQLLLPPLFSLLQCFHFSITVFQ